MSQFLKGSQENWVIKQLIVVCSGFNTDYGSSEPLKTLVMLCYHKDTHTHPHPHTDRPARPCKCTHTHTHTRTHTQTHKCYHMGHVSGAFQDYSHGSSIGHI